jgi:hypothetical protein
MRLWGFGFVSSSLGPDLDSMNAAEVLDVVAPTSDVLAVPAPDRDWWPDEVTSVERITWTPTANGWGWVPTRGDL